MEKPEFLLCVSLPLTPRLEGLPHTLELVNDFLLPTTIDAAVYNDLQRLVRIYGPSRTWTCRAMDGAAARGRLDILQRLHDSRSEGCSDVALYDAADQGHLEVVKWLIKHYDTIFPLRTPLTCTAMMYAAIGGKADVVQYLRPHRRRIHLKFFLKKVVELNCLDAIAAIIPSNGVRTSEALQTAVENERVEALELLLRLSPTTDATLALQTAIKNHHLHIIRMILHRGNPFDTSHIFQVAAATGRVDVVDVLLPTSDSVSISAALMTAVSRGCVDVMRFLLEQGQSTDPEFVFLMAAYRGQRESVKQLLDTWEI